VTKNFNLVLSNGRAVWKMTTLLKLSHRACEGWFVLSLCLWLSSTNHAIGQTEGKQGQRDLKAVVAKVEALRKQIEEWGIVTVSEPIAVPTSPVSDMGDVAKFKSAGDYIEAARAGIQGGASQSTGSYFGSSTQGAITAKSSSPGDSNTQGANELSVTVPSPSATPIPSESGLSYRQAILVGVNDKILEDLLRTMVNLKSNQDSRYYIRFVMVQFSVNPGWRTEENYIADCSATVRYDSGIGQADGKSTASSAPQGGPSVFSILPLLDAQTLELTNTNQQVVELLARLTAQYPSSVGQININQLLKFVKSYQRNAASRTPLTVANSYSSGNTFGFRIAPSFTALRDPAARRSGTANRLIATSFPVLVTIVYKKAEFGNGKWVRVDLSSRWLVYQRPPLVWWPGRLGLPLKRQTEAMRVDWAGKYDVVNSKIYDDRNFALLRGTEEYETLERDLTELKAKALDHSGRVWVPAPIDENQGSGGKPSLSKVDCSTFSTGTQIILALHGRNLIKPGVAFIGKVASTNVDPISAQLCLASFPPTLRSGSDLTNAQVKLYCESGVATATVKIDLPPLVNDKDDILPLPTPSVPPTQNK
jgi:hypothetical protein